MTIAAKREYNDREAERLRCCLARNEFMRERVEKGVAKSYLMHGRFFFQGQSYEPKVRHLGLGVYEVWATLVE